MDAQPDSQTAAPMASERRYCQDCRFFAAKANGKEYGTCDAPGATSASGARFIAPEFNKRPYASTMRSFGGCGEDAAWFEPSPSNVIVGAFDLAAAGAGLK